MGKVGAVRAVRERMEKRGAMAQMQCEAERDREREQEGERGRKSV